MESDPKWDGLSAKAPEADLVYLKEFMPGYNGGVAGNGTHRYAPDLASGGLAAGSDVYENLESGGSPALHLKVGGAPGVAVLQMASPYGYLGGRIKVSAFWKGPGDSVKMYLSTNNARSFSLIWQTPQAGNDAKRDTI